MEMGIFPYWEDDLLFSRWFSSTVGFGDGWPSSVFPPRWRLPATHVVREPLKGTTFCGCVHHEFQLALSRWKILGVVPTSQPRSEAGVLPPVSGVEPCTPAEKSCPWKVQGWDMTNSLYCRRSQ